MSNKNFRIRYCSRKKEIKGSFDWNGKKI